MLLIAVLAPYLGTVDPTALAPAKRTRSPSADYWFGTDMFGRDIYSRVHLRRASIAAWSVSRSRSWRRWPAS